VSEGRGYEDVLARATRALREEDAASAAASSAARGPWQAMDGWSGVVRDLRRAGRRRRLVVVGGMQIGLALAGLGAWAAASGRLPALFFARPSSAPAAPAPRPARHHARRAQLASPLAPEAPVEAPPPVEAAPPVEAPAPPVAPQPPPVVHAPPPAPRRPRPAPVSVAAPAPAPVPAPAPAVEAPSPDAALYEEAHRAHFVRKDYAAALAAWDRYLALGAVTFRPEARYNRAIALIRLGRRDEARAALLPFATGEYGGYRAEEARALLKMLSPPP
jgi:hypothetical protein